MIKHIVMWDFADNVRGATKAANLATAREMLLGLADLVPGMLTLEPVIPTQYFEHSFDLVLYSEFDSVDALKAYAQHPEHLRVADFITSVRTKRICVDYEIVAGE